jgi:hypothetical protein
MHPCTTWLKTRGFGGEVQQTLVTVADAAIIYWSKLVSPENRIIVDELRRTQWRNGLCRLLFGFSVSSVN